MFVLLVLLLCCNWPSWGAVIQNSYEVINHEGTNELSWVSNLQMDWYDHLHQTKTLYFTADRGQANVFTAQFYVGGPASSFNSSGISPYNSAARSLPGFLTFDISGDNVIGPVYTLPGIGVQNVYRNSSGIYSSITYMSHLRVTNVHVDPKFNTLTKRAYVYMGGWDQTRATSAFFVGRSSFLAATPSPVDALNTSDLVYVKTSNCFDLYDDRRSPKIFIYYNYIILLITGKCATFARITIPEPGAPWSSANVSIFDPTANGGLYVSSAMMDEGTGIIYYGIQLYNKPNASIYSLDVQIWSNSTKIEDIEELNKEAEYLIVLGASNTKKYLFVICSGADRIEKWEIESPIRLSNKELVLLDVDLAAVSSALFYYPHLYFTTYEPDAKIARISIDNFCDNWCSSKGYCSLGVCYCQLGYYRDSSGNCIINEVFVRDIRVTGLAIAFSFTLVAFLVTLLLLWRSRARSRQYTPTN